MKEIVKILLHINERDNFGWDALNLSCKFYRGPGVAEIVQIFAQDPETNVSSKACGYTSTELFFKHNIAQNDGERVIQTLLCSKSFRLEQEHYLVFCITQPTQAAGELFRYSLLKHPNTFKMQKEDRFLST